MTEGVRTTWSLDAPLDDFVIVQREDLLPDERGERARWGPLWKHFPAWGQDEAARAMALEIYREVTSARYADLDDDALAAWLDEAFVTGRLVLLCFPRALPLLQREEPDDVPADPEGGDTEEPDDPCTQRVFPLVEVVEPVSETITNVPDPSFDPWRDKTFGWTARFSVLVDRSRTEVKAKVKIKVTGTITEPQKSAWKSAIESTWNGKAKISAPDPACPAFRGDYDVVIEIEYVASGEHQEVRAWPPTGGAGGGTHGLGGTRNMNNWGFADTIDVRHEFGHMLGNVEEYFTTNGVDYTRGGTRAGYRDADGGIMNNPANAPALTNYEIIRRHAQRAMGGIACTLRAP